MDYIRRALSIILIALLSLGCQPSWLSPEVSGHLEPIETRICVDISGDEMEAAEEAVKQWDKALKQWRHMKFVPGISGDCYITVIEVNPSDTPESARAALAWVPGVGMRSVFMVRGRYERDTTGILMHELGHAMGASHLPLTLMNWQHRGKVMYICPDAATVAQVAAWHRVDLRLMSWCSV